VTPANNNSKNINVWCLLRIVKTVERISQYSSAVDYCCALTNGIKQIPNLKNTPFFYLPLLTVPLFSPSFSISFTPPPSTAKRLLSSLKKSEAGL